MSLWTITRKVTAVNLHLCWVKSNTLQLTEKSDLTASAFNQTVRQRNRIYSQNTLLIKENEQQS